MQSNKKESLAKRLMIVSPSHHTANSERWVGDAMILEGRCAHLGDAMILGGRCVHLGDAIILEGRCTHLGR